MIALLENEFVERKKWIKKDDFLNMVAIAESTPDWLAINSTHIYRLQNCRLIRCWVAATVAVCISFVYRNFLHLHCFLINSKPLHGFFQVSATNTGMCDLSDFLCRAENAENH